MRSTLAAAIGATALLGATAPLPALGQHIATGPRVMGIVTPAQHIVPKDGAYVLVLMEVAGPRDKILCSRFVQRYGAAQAYDAGSGAYGLYWIVGAPRALTSDDCASAPVSGLADGL